MTVSEVARLVKGKVTGNPRKAITRIAPLEEASPDALSFYFGAKPDVSSKAGCVVTRVKLPRIKNQIVVTEPRLALFKLLSNFQDNLRVQAASARPKGQAGACLSETQTCSRGQFTLIESGVKIGKNVSIGAFSYIGKSVVIGSDVRIEPRVTILDNVRVGSRVFIQSGAVIGSQGFGYLKQAGRYKRMPHIGRVVIEDDVDIGANVTIDRGTISDTVVGKGTKIDNLVHVGHNVRIGRNCLIIAQVGISGSVRIGNSVILAGQVGIKDHVEIGDRSIIYAKSAVLKSVPKGAIYSGNPARDHYETMRAYARLFQESKNDSPQADLERSGPIRKKNKR